MAEFFSVRRYTKLVFVPMVLALIGVWGLLFNLSLSERRSPHAEHVQSQLSFTVRDAGRLQRAGTAQPRRRRRLTPQTPGRTAAIWRALLQYPSASIWVEEHGVLSAGQPPPGNRAAMIVGHEERRGDWSVHAALPRKDALAEWERGVWQRAIITALISLAFLGP